MYSCSNDGLVYPPTGSLGPFSASPTSISPSAASSSTSECEEQPSQLHLSSPPYENYFYSDCHSASQVVVTSPRPDSNLTIIGPRLLVAWPAGNSGAVAFFAPQSGVNGSLAIQLVNGTNSQALEGVYDASGDGNAVFGVTAVLELNSSAVLNIAILGSIRNIRDFTEGPSILTPEIQGAVEFSEVDGDGAGISRLWLDNVTTTQMSFTPLSDDSAVEIDNGTPKQRRGGLSAKTTRVIRRPSRRRELLDPLYV